MKQITTLIFIFTLSTLSLVNAQNSETNWELGVGYALTPATGILSDNGYGTNHGIYTDFFYVGLRNKFISLSPGIRFNFGSSSSDQVSVRIPEPDIEIGNANMRNSYADFKLVSRVAIFESGIIKPYGEFSAGLRRSAANQIFSLDSTIDSNGDIGTASNTDRLNSIYSYVYGFGIGVLISLPDNVAIDLRVNQDWTGSLTYLDLDEDINSDFFVTDNVKTISFNVGIRYRFACDEEEDVKTID